MKLTKEEVEQFFKIHRSLMCFVNQRLQVIPDFDTPDQFFEVAPEARSELRDAFKDDPGLIKLFVEANPFDLNDEELAIISSWQHQVYGQFIFFRQLAKYMVVLQTSEPPVAYGVLALSDSFEDLLGPGLPRLVETLLLPFKGKIIYDGVLGSSNISFGGGIKRSLNDSYKAAKDRLGLITSLPISAKSAPAKKTTKKSKAKPTKASTDVVRHVVDTVIKMTNRFCGDHLNEEYAVLCRRLAEKLARKRPTPLLTSKPKYWACGIVRTIGFVNFLDDRSSKPHMKLTAIDKVFEVGESTGQSKSKAIRKMFKIHQFGHEWMLPSRMEDNGPMWMLEINGFVMDVRECSRDIQEYAFKKGLIPYIPADRD